MVFINTFMLLETALHCKALRCAAMRCNALRCSNLTALHKSGSIRFAVIIIIAISMHFEYFFQLQS